MPDTKITALVELGSQQATPSSLIVVVDVADTSMAASGTNKKMNLVELKEALIAYGIVDHTALLGKNFLP